MRENKMLENYMDRIPNPPVHLDIENASLIIKYLQKTIDDNIEGDIVELGCHQWLTSIFIQLVKPENKDFYVYDSFEWLPEPTAEDENNCDLKFQKGWLLVHEQEFVRNFLSNNIELPIMRKWRFAEIPDDQYPEKISFAFFDGDLYQSMIDSFNKVYHKMTPWGIICLHDYSWEVLPWVKRACDDFLANKFESVQVDNWLWFIIKA